ncbi:MAG: class F sortase [Propionibacteriaceae bacterium]|nr:class F sortase [Propionibacteriaceae bacterium]
MSNQEDSVVPSGGQQQPEKKKKRRFASILMIVLAVLLIGGGTTIIVTQLWPGSKSQAGELVDLEGNVIVPDDPSATSSAFMQQANMVADDGGQGFVVPSVNLDVPVGSVNAVNGVMNPPGYTSVFLIRNLGVGLDKADQGTVYMVAHAVYGGKAPGNYLQANQQTLLKPGDIIKVNQLTYQFVESQIIPKTEISSHADLWDESQTGRLVLVTCQVNPKGGIAVNNMVIIAQLVQ